MQHCVCSYNKAFRITHTPATRYSASLKEVLIVSILYLQTITMFDVQNICNNERHC